jgi:hypothetical protein
MALNYEIRLRERRQDRTTATVVHHAQTLRAMAGAKAATAFLLQADVDPDVVERVLRRDRPLRKTCVLTLLETLR